MWGGGRGGVGGGGDRQLSVSVGQLVTLRSAHSSLLSTMASIASDEDCELLECNSNSVCMPI